VKKDPRHRAREAALQILYQWEVGGVDVVRAANTFFELQWPDKEPADAAIRAFASSLARDTVDAVARADELIAETAERWRPERMALVDRLILRMAVSEMIRDPAMPPAVVINEALELAKTFSTAESARFINGMLDAIRKKIEPR
jgi:transcription antitermination protein NusB